MSWNPEDYAGNNSAQVGWARELISRKAFGGTESVLDVGCGDGAITAEFARALPEGYVLGVDASPEFVAYADERHAGPHAPGLEFRRMDARRLELDRRFDLIFSNAVLHWVDDHPAFLRGASEHLRPGGRLVVSCGGEGNASGIVAAITRTIHEPAWRDYFQGFTFPYHFLAPRDYATWLPAAGLRSSRCELVEKDMTHESPAGLIGWLRTTWTPYTLSLPEDLRRPFLDEVVADYLAETPPDADGRTHVRMVRLEVEAVKPGD